MRQAHTHTLAARHNVVHSLYRESARRNLLFMVKVPRGPFAPYIYRRFMGLFHRPHSEFFYVIRMTRLLCAAIQVAHEWTVRRRRLRIWPACKIIFSNPITACTRSATRRQRASPRRLFNSEVRKSQNLVAAWFQQRFRNVGCPAGGRIGLIFTARWRMGPGAGGGRGRSACAPSPNGPPRAAPSAPLFAAVEAINYAVRQDGRRRVSQWGGAAAIKSRQSACPPSAVALIADEQTNLEARQIWVSTLGARSRSPLPSSSAARFIHVIAFIKYV